jgi:hypothetical protein
LAWALLLEVRLLQGLMEAVPMTWYLVTSLPVAGGIKNSDMSVVGEKGVKLDAGAISVTFKTQNLSSQNSVRIWDRLTSRWCRSCSGLKWWIISDCSHSISIQQFEPPLFRVPVVSLSSLLARTACLYGQFAYCAYHRESPRLEEVHPGMTALELVWLYHQLLT